MFLLDVIVRDDEALDFELVHLLPIDVDTSNLYVPLVSEPDVHDVVATVATLV